MDWSHPEVIGQLAGGAFVALLVLAVGWSNADARSPGLRWTGRILSVVVALAIMGGALGRISELHGSGESDEEIRSALLRGCLPGCEAEGVTASLCQSICDCGVDDMIARLGFDGLRELARRGTDAIREEGVRSGEICSEQHPEWTAASDSDVGSMPSDGYPTGRPPRPVKIDATVFARPMPGFYPLRNDSCPTGYTPRDGWCLHPSVLDWPEERLSAAIEEYRLGGAPPEIAPLSRIE